MLAFLKSLTICFLRRDSWWGTWRPIWLPWWARSFNSSLSPTLLEEFLHNIGKPRTLNFGMSMVLDQSNVTMIFLYYIYLPFTFPVTMNFFSLTTDVSKVSLDRQTVDRLFGMPSFSEMHRLMLLAIQLWLQIIFLSITFIWVISVFLSQLDHIKMKLFMNSWWRNRWKWFNERSARLGRKENAFSVDIACGHRLEKINFISKMLRNVDKKLHVLESVWRFPNLYYKYLT